MTFLQPFLLFALPLIGLPILIHLINQNRHRTIPWAATMFLLQAKRMARGMARLRYILIMLARMIAVAGLIFAISRPMAGGWLGLTTSGAPELTVVILDRSASMEEQDPKTGDSKRSTALEKLSSVFRDLGRNTRIALFDSATGNRYDLDSASALTKLPEAEATSTSADIPSLMQAATEYILASEAGRTDVWVCSDLRQSDWSPSSGRWESVREQLRGRDGVSLYLLTYQDLAPDNLAVSVSGVHRRETVEGAELVMDLKLTRTAAIKEPIHIPVTFVIGGARSTVDLELTGTQLVRNGHTIPIDRELKRGWGRVELPRDANLVDNVYDFVYAEPAIQKTVIVSDESDVSELLRLAAGTPSDRSLIYEAQVVSSSQAPAIEWDNTALILWQAPLPTDVLAKQLESFVARGGCVMFFPPETPTDQSMFGTHWGQWRDPAAGDHFALSRWRTDADLLGNSQSGKPLPVGQVITYRSCEIVNDQGTVLAQLSDGPPLLLRANTDQGAAWFCSTLPNTSNSNFVSNGITFYVMIQRAVARGAAALGEARQFDCGTLKPGIAESWTPLDETSGDVLLSQRTLNNGLYETPEATFALNRPLAEDAVEVLSDGTLEQVMSGLNYTRIDDKAGSSMALASEIWRTFLIAMIIALMAEALLCVPEKATADVEAKPIKREPVIAPFPRKASTMKT
ncbi:MAG TPA: BatA domain-containing protein [Planctomycetaceae bacterium]|nr:BatA domain-containing protein [Planctomycetaceae bacterium]